MTTLCKTPPNLQPMDNFAGGSMEESHLDTFHCYYPQLRKRSTFHVLVDHTCTHTQSRPTPFKTPMHKFMLTHIWKVCTYTVLEQDRSLNLETIAWALTALCWWIYASYRVTVTLHSSRFTYSWHSAPRTTCSLPHSPWGECHGSDHYSLYSERDQNAHITHGRFLLGYVPASQSLPCCTGIRNVWPARRTVQSGMLTFSFSPLLPRMLPRHSLQFHRTSFNFLTGRKSQGQELHLPLRLSGPSLCSSLVRESQSKFGSVISGWPEPVFVRIILHRRLGLKP